MMLYDNVTYMFIKIEEEKSTLTCLLNFISIFHFEVNLRIMV